MTRRAKPMVVSTPGSGLRSALDMHYGLRSQMPTEPKEPAVQM
jgi:hypothetical protein